MGEDVQVEDVIGIVDFLESELTFCEFQRLLLRISEEKTQGIDPDLAWRLPTHRRLEGFLMHVFLPSVANSPDAKQVEQPAAEAEAPEGDESAVQGGEEELPVGEPP